MQFHGKSTLHDFDGTMPRIPLKVTVTGAKGSRVVHATSEVPVKKMTTAKAERDQNMWNMFQEAQHHLIKVTVERAQESALRPQGNQPGSMPVHLAIAGHEGNTNGAVTNLTESPTELSFDLAFTVSLKAFSLTPPSAVGGMVKVKDDVEVKAHVTLSKDKGS